MNREYHLPRTLVLRACAIAAVAATALLFGGVDGLVAHYSAAAPAFADQAPHVAAPAA